jgi:hypothetical protein
MSELLNTENLRALQNIIRISSGLWTIKTKSKVSTEESLLEFTMTGLFVYQTSINI